VLAVRRRQALDEVARECELAGGQTLAVATDVSPSGEELARRAVQRFGRINVWVIRRCRFAG